MKEPGLDYLVYHAHKQKTLTATTNTKKAVGESDIIVVIVPVLLDEHNLIDYQWIDLAVENIAKGLQKGSLIIFETTLPPGDTRNRFGKKIEEISGLKMGKDFDLAYSPERVYSNRIIQDLKEYPKVVGGLNEASLKRAIEFYKKALQCDIIPVSSLETAEFSKVAECVYRDVNIALANELAIFAEKTGVSITEVIQASNSQPFSHLHSPGIGVGGHCIPIYPYFFICKGIAPGITTLSRQINDGMATFALKKLENKLGSLKNKQVLILGLSYRENVKETTKSTALAIIDLLQQAEAKVYVHDPFFTDNEIKDFNVLPFSFQEKLMGNIDAIILQAYHDEYKTLDLQPFSRCQAVLDGRNRLDRQAVEALGMEYIGIGG